MSHLRTVALAALICASPALREAIRTLATRTRDTLLRDSKVFSASIDDARPRVMRLRLYQDCRMTREEFIVHRPSTYR